MITPSYNLTATQSVLPRLALDFTTASLDPRVTVIRVGATATRFNNSGLIETVAADTPRFDFNPLTLSCRGLLIEEQRTNLVTYSEDFNNADWTKARSSITANTIVAPDGTLTGDKLIANTANDTHRLTFTGSFVSGNTYTYSIFAKADELQRFLFRTGVTAFGVNANATFNLETGNAVFASPWTSARADPVGNGWFRCSATITASATATTSDGLYIDMLGGPTSSRTFVGNNIDGFYIWGAQLEIGAFPTSYIPTEASQVTRSADVATMTSTNFSDWYNASKGTFRTDFISIANGNLPVISVDDNTADESLILKTQGTAPTFEVVDGGSPQASVVAGTVAANTSAFAYASYDINYFGIARPSARQVDTSGTVPTVDRMRIGSDQSANYFNGHVQTVQYWE
jgi:hypothetical protein